MTSFWSGWIIVLTLACLVVCFVLLVWNLKNYTHVEEGESMGHKFDGIEELNNPMPKWWTYMFFFTFVWGAIYLIAYPGLGNWQGLLGWTSSNQTIKSLAESKAAVKANLEAGLYVEYDQENVKADERFGPLFDQFAKRDILDLAYDVDALKVGQRLFIQNCSQCHGSDGRGQRGFPNLADTDWLFGGTPAQIKETILHGRVAAMPAWGEALGEQGVKDMTAYVLSLSGRKVNDKDAAAGKTKFAMCSACHGMDGKGSLANNMPMGAPDLTDNVWLYGGSSMAIEDTLNNGRNGVMPAWLDILGEEKVHILTAYVYRLSNPDAK